MLAARLAAVTIPRRRVAKLASRSPTEEVAQPTRRSRYLWGANASAET